MNTVLQSGLDSGCSIADLVAQLEQADSSARLVAAVASLAATRDPAAIPSLIQVLGYNNPGAAMAAVDGLVSLGSVAVPSILAQIDGYNYGARSYAIRALAAIADPRALDVLLAAAETDFAPSVRRAAIKGLGCLRWEQHFQSAPVSAHQRVLTSLLTISQDEDWTIRYATIVALQAFANAIPASYSVKSMYDALWHRLLELATADRDSSVRIRARLAQQQLTHLYPISTTPDLVLQGSS